LIICIEIKL